MIFSPSPCVVFGKSSVCAAVVCRADGCAFGVFVDGGMIVLLLPLQSGSFARHDEGACLQAFRNSREREPTVLAFGVGKSHRGRELKI